MNMTLVIIIIAAIIALTGIIMGIRGKSAWISLFFLLGVVCEVIGGWLFGAESWRNIAMGFIVAGLILFMATAGVVKFRRSREAKAKAKAEAEKEKAAQKAAAGTDEE